MDSARKAALRLAALGRKDREWMWSRLNSAERNKVKPQLDELLSLPIGALRQEAQKLRRSSVPVPAMVVKHREVSDLAALRHASPREVVHLVSELPAGTIALLLGIEKWWWGDAVLKNLDAVRRRSVEDLMRGPNRPVNGTLGEWLIAQLVERLRLEPGRASASSNKFDALLERAE